MKTVTIYIDDYLNVRDMLKLEHEIMAMPYVVDVERPRDNTHGLTIDYEPHAGLPCDVLKNLRSKGLHPDIVSG